MGEDKGKSFIKGAAILTAAGMIAKVMGFVYRIILTRLIGSEGMGLYTLAYPVYTTLLVVSRSGIPVSLAKLISAKIVLGERKAAYDIFHVGRQLSLWIGLFFSLLMALLAKPLIQILSWDPRTYYPLLALSPAILFVSIMATYRGFFQGIQNMKPTAYSQVIEQFVRMVTMIILVYLLVPYGYGLAAAGATFGAVTGSIAGLLVLIYIYYKKREEIWQYIQNDIEEKKIDYWNIVKEIATVAIPITMAALVQPLMSLVDAAIVPQRLQIAGYSISKATELIGDLGGIAMVLVNFPTIITVSLASSLVPSISEAYALKQKNLIKRRTQTGLRLAVLIGLPASVGLYLMATPLTEVIFATPKAAIPLRIVSWGVFFIALQQTSSAVLQGIGRTTIPARNLFVGALLNALINYSLTALPQFGIRGAALGTVSGFAVAAILNLISVRKYTAFEFDFRDFFLKPIISVIVMGFVVSKGFLLIHNFLANYTKYNYSIATFLIVFLAVIVYSILLLLFKEITYSDLVMIPKVGRSLADILKKIGLVRD